MSDANGNNRPSETSSDDEDEFPTPESLRRANNQCGETEQTFDDHGVPEPRPLWRTRNEVFVLADFEAVDDRACMAPVELVNQPLQRLVRYLTKRTSSELERVRVIYRWITAQNLARLKDRKVNRPPKTAWDYLIGIKNKKIRYHSLMADMCRQVNIVTEKIDGYVKHAKYEIGEKVSEKIESTWTAVLIDRSWYLVDVLWSSQKVSGVSSGEWMLLDDNGKMVDNPSREANVKKDIYKYDESYFLTNPEEFIYSHFPEDSRWQLLARKVNVDEFRNMAYLKMSFFECGLRLCNHKMCLIDAPDGVASIQLAVSYPRNHFKYRLWISNKSKRDRQTELCGHTKLTRFVFMENRDGFMKCDISFPVAGIFKLEFLCNNNRSPSSSYHCVCAYVLTAGKAAANCKPLPHNRRSEWGPGYDLENAGLRPLTHKKGIVKAADGETELRFEADSNVEILTRLHSDTKTKKELERFVIHRIEEPEIVINVKVPEKDDYVLSIYAGRHNDEEDATLNSVCSYLISASKPAADPTPFPRVRSGRYGQIRNYSSTFEVKPVSHPSAFITAPENGDQLNLTLDVTPPDVTELLTELMFYQGDVVMELERYTFIEITGVGHARIAVRFPKRGQYVLSIFGKNTKTGGETASYKLAYRYLIRADRTTNWPMCSPFPVIYNKWTKLCQLVEPDISRPIIEDSKVLFNVKIPNSVNVAVYKSEEVNNQCTNLTCCDGLWNGVVRAGKAGEKLCLYAGFVANSNKLSCLLEFEVNKLNLCQQQVRDCFVVHCAKRYRPMRKRKYLSEVINGVFNALLWHGVKCIMR